MRALFFLAGFASLSGCSASVRRPVSTTDAAMLLEQVTHSGQNEFDPAISPDARAIAYEVAASEDATPHVEVMALKDGENGSSGAIEYSSKDTIGLEPAWMPDGSGLIFVSRTMGSPIGLVQTIGQRPDRTAFLAAAGNPSLLAEWPAVSPDGKTMAMSLMNIDVFQTGWRTSRSFGHFGRALGLSDLIGTGVTVLGDGTSPAWSPDGKRIAFSRTTHGHAHLFVADADGKNLQQITDGLGDDLAPSWSPHGRSLAFCSAHGRDHFTQANLFAVRADGSGLVQLTEGDRLVGRPTWAKDGFVYFHANVTDQFHIWRIRVEID